MESCSWLVVAVPHFSPLRPSSWFDGLRRFTILAGAEAEPPVLVHGGTTNGLREGVRLVPWAGLASLANAC